ncbi:MAG TPA: hypothetical protein VLN59_02225, partial [Burkholderiales bacterium]|nr:hypothetical protein [Burkholderiales bacterium]
AAWEGRALRRLVECDLSDEQLRPLLARRAAVRELKPHFRTATQREMEMLAKRRARQAQEVETGGSR